MLVQAEAPRRVRVIAADRVERGKIPVARRGAALASLQKTSLAQNEHQNIRKYPHVKYTYTFEVI